MAVGELIHSEVRGSLRQKGITGWELDFTMDIVLETDEIFREFATKADQDSRTARNHQSVEGAKSLIMGRSQERAKGQEEERKSKVLGG